MSLPPLQFHLLFLFILRLFLFTAGNYIRRKWLISSRCLALVCAGIGWQLLARTEFLCTIFFAAAQIILFRHTVQMVLVIIKNTIFSALLFLFLLVTIIFIIARDPGKLYLLGLKVKRQRPGAVR